MQQDWCTLLNTAIAMRSRSFRRKVPGRELSNNTGRKRIIKN
jgi:hypothetical protein